MKGRESGMPEEAYWNSFYDVEAGLDLLMGKGPLIGNLVEFGCGYGTFSLPAARRMEGVVTALDIEPAMTSQVEERALAMGLSNVAAIVCDFVGVGTGLGDETQTHVMIYNLLHLEDPMALLQEAKRILEPGGRLSIIHWRSDIPTPRGPSLEIRPRPEQVRGWLEKAGFRHVTDIDLQNSCPYHYGLIASH